MSKKQIALTLLFLLVSISGVTIGTSIIGRRTQEREAMNIQLAGELRADLLIAIDHYVQENDHVPPSFDRLYDGGYYLFSPDQFNRMIELGHNGTPGGMPVANYLRQHFHEAMKMRQDRMGEGLSDE